MKWVTFIHDKFINYFIRLWHHLYVYIKTYDRKICDQLAFNYEFVEKCRNYHNPLKIFLVDSDLYLTMEAMK